jgi:hypothetical protein
VNDGFQNKHGRWTETLAARNHWGSGLLGVRARGGTKRGGDRELMEMLTTVGSDGRRRISAGGYGGQQLGAVGLRDGDDASKAISRRETTQGVQLSRAELLVESSSSYRAPTR